MCTHTSTHTNTQIHTQPHSPGHGESHFGVERYSKIAKAARSVRNLLLFLISFVSMRRFRFRCRLKLDLCEGQ